MKKILIIASAIVFCLGANAQERDINARARAAKQAGGTELANFKKELKAMTKGNVEKPYLDASNAYYTLGETATSDSLRDVIQKKFPKGVLSRNMALNALYKIEGGAEIEKAYKSWYKTYPKEKMGEDIVYDYAAYAVANNYAEENNVEKAESYLSKISDPRWSGTAYSVIGKTFSDKGNNAEAEKILAQAATKADAAEKTDDNPMMMREYQNVHSAYADVLVKNGKMNEALAEYNKVPAAQRGIGYAQVMNSNGHPMQAFTYADSQLRKGNSSEAVESVLKTAWEKANGNLDGYDDYVQGIKDKRIADKKSEALKSMISEKAADFELKDVDGNTVRLSDLKGKVVILDFWATWCGPCKNSLPAMKMTVDKYKSDPNVQFLFIHTWEHGTPEAATKDAKEYLDSHGFSEFHLLMDTKDPKTHTNNAVNAYGVRGIPAKFIIDGNGNIRFKISGFSGSNEEAVAELSTMIDACKNAK